MTIFSDGLREPPQRTLADYPATLGESLGASASEAFSENPSTQLYGMVELGAAKAQGHLEADEFGGLNLTGDDAPGTAPKRVPMTEAKARVQQEGLDKHIHLPEQPDINEPALDIMIKRARTRLEHEATIARGPAGMVPGALSMGTSLLVGAVDPLNIAAGFVPVLGEARYAKMIASAGDSVVGRAAVRAGAGAVSGAAYTAAFQPIEAMAHTQEGRDFTMSEALRNVMYGAAFFAGLHSGGGALSDIARSVRGRPIYPFAPGEPHFKEIPGVGVHVPGHVLSEEGVTAEALAAPHPYSAWDQHIAGLEDLPPRAKEDALRIGIANLAQDRPVNAAEVLNVAAKEDPRIAESIEAWHGSPHDFERFDLSKIGTGEGAQSYGHGLYVAEKPDVARDYQKTTSHADFIRKARELYGEFDSPGEAHEALAESKDFTPSQKRLLTALEKDDWLGFDYPHQAVTAAVREPENFEMSAETHAALRDLGNLYKVRINANKEHFLDWDKPLSEQSAHVRAAARKLGIPESSKGVEAYHEMVDRLARQPNDEDMEHADRVGLPWQEFIKRDPAAASRALHEAGIHGIKYLDQGSRNAQRAVELSSHPEDLTVPPNTHNFVVFDDKLIEITEKNGQPLKPEGTKGPRKASRDAATWSLFEFLAANGGLHPEDKVGRDSAGHVVAGGAKDTGGMSGDLGAVLDSKPFVPGFGPLLRKSGHSLDRARELAEEAGYLPKGSSVRDLLDAVSAEARGRKQYIAGNEAKAAETPAATKLERERYLDDMERFADNQFREAGIETKDIDERFLKRTLEIMDKEGEHDALLAYERAVMEDAEHSEASGHARRDAVKDIAGWDVPADAGAAPGARGAVPEDRPGAGQGAPATGAGDRAPAAGQAGPDWRGIIKDVHDRMKGLSAADIHAGRFAEQLAEAKAGRGADWRSLAERPASYEDERVVAQSEAAGKQPEPGSQSPVPSERVKAAEAAAAQAEAEYKLSEPFLPDDLKAEVDQRIAALDLEAADRTEIIRRGAACLASFAGVA